MIDFLIVGVRFPVGVVINAMAFVIYVAFVLPVSAAIIPFAFGYAAVFWSKKEIHESWIGNWPFRRQVHEVWDRVWKWVLNTED
jgi:hypothetical protein